MYIVQPQRSAPTPVFRSRSFRQAVRWCLTAQAEGALTCDAYDIIGAESGLDDKELVATFYPA